MDPTPLVLSNFDSKLAGLLVVTLPSVYLA